MIGLEEGLEERMMLLDGKVNSLVEMVLQLLPAPANQQQYTMIPQVSTSAQGPDSIGSEMEYHV